MSPGNSALPVTHLRAPCEQVHTPYLSGSTWPLMSFRGDGSLAWGKASHFSCLGAVASAHLRQGHPPPLCPLPLVPPQSSCVHRVVGSWRSFPWTGCPSHPTSSTAPLGAPSGPGFPGYRHPVTVGLHCRRLEVGSAPSTRCSGLGTWHCVCPSRELSVMFE